jgi:protoporphyrinogen oxidase
VDVDRKVATVERRRAGGSARAAPGTYEIRFERLVSSAPLNRLAAMCGLDDDPRVWAWNKVLVFNLGFDGKGQRDVHWTYYPSRDTVFYRVGWYDNILGTDRLSLYVEIGYTKDAPVDVEAAKKRTLADLAREGVVTTQRLVADHHVVLDPAYVHITTGSMAARQRLTDRLAPRGIHSIGRYGRWTYCSIEDNIVEARALVQSWRAG